MMSRHGVIPAMTLAILAFGVGARAEFACFTYSQGILFRADNPTEAVSRTRVIQACVEHPATLATECQEHLNCFEQPSPRSRAGSAREPEK